jgi:hypothetical protein
MSKIIDQDERSNSQGRCSDIARRWLTTCSNGNCYYLVQALADFSDDQLADNCICRWGLDQPQGDDNDITWFEQHGANRQMLIEAFSAMRFYFRNEVLGDVSKHNGEDTP